MSRVKDTGCESEHCFYEVRLDGRLDPCCASWFGATSVRRVGQNQTLLLCPVADQAALFGLLRKVRDLGLSLAAVKRIDCVLSSE